MDKKRIKELRQEKGLTLLQVANYLGVSEATAQRYESGKITNLKYDTIVKLSELFKVSPAYLMGWEDENEYDPLKDANLEKVEEIYHFPKGTIELIHLYNALDPSCQRQVIDYAKFLLSQNGDLSEDK